MKTNKPKNVPEPRAPISTTMFGLATVHPSNDPNWVRWGVVYPGDRKTEWFKSSQKAHEAASNYNEGK